MKIGKIGLKAAAALQRLLLTKPLTLADLFAGLTPDNRPRSHYHPRRPRNPAGAKLIRKFYRNKHGMKADYTESFRWYSETRR